MILKYEYDLEIACQAVVNFLGRKVLWSGGSKTNFWSLRKFLANTRLVAVRMEIVGITKTVENVKGRTINFSKQLSNNLILIPTKRYVQRKGTDFKQKRKSTLGLLSSEVYLWSVYVVILLTQWEFIVPLSSRFGLSFCATNKETGGKNSCRFHPTNKILEIIYNILW